MDGSTAGLTNGPRHIIFNSGNWSTIGQQAIYVKQSSTTTGIGTRNVVSYGNFYAENVANDFGGVNSISEVPVLQFDNDECTSILDFLIFLASILITSLSSSYIFLNDEIMLFEKLTCKSV